MKDQREFSPTYAMHRALRERFARSGRRAECFLRPDGSHYELARYGPCEGQLQAHHLIPQRTLRRLYLARHFDGVPLSVILADDRNGVLVCERHHRLLDGILVGRSRIRLRLLDLPRRLFEFLDQFALWAEAERLYVRPSGHSTGDGGDASTSRAA